MTNHALEIPAGKDIELRGPVRLSSKQSLGSFSIHVDRNLLPRGIVVKHPKLINNPGGPAVHLTICNTSKSSVTISSKDVLARLQNEILSDNQTPSDCVFDGLVGPACETEAVVNGIPCAALLDSGSQVTTISTSFFMYHFAGNTPLEQVPDGSFKVEGAGGQSVPYDGFARIKVKFLKEIVGTETEVETLALICPDNSYTEKIPLIVGTNTFRTLSKFCEKECGHNFLRNLPIRAEVAYAYKDSNMGSDGKIGTVKLFHKRPTKLSPGEMREFKGVCKSQIPITRDALLVQESEDHTLPPGVQVINSLTPTIGHLPRVKVLIQNVTNKDIVVYPWKVKAALHSVEYETSLTELQRSAHSFLQGIGSNPLSSPASDENATDKESDLVHEPLVFDFGESVLSPEWEKRITKTLLSFSDVFSRHEFDVGKTDAVEHEIKLKDGPIVKERPRPIPVRDFEDARRYIQSLLDAQIIKPSNSPYASPIVLVRKKSGKLRLCVDYRKINLRTVPDAYSIPKISDIFSSLHGAKWFTTMDLKMGFHQIPMSEASKDYTAFVCPFGLFNFERMSQGLTNSPMTFQRLMEKCVGDMNFRELLVYLDDIIIHASTLEQAEERLIKTLHRLRAFGLKVDPSKCKFFQKSVKHLGHIVSENGVQPDPDKISALTTWPYPSTLRDLKKFLGFTGYFRQFVDNYSQIVKPLNQLTAGYIPPKTLKKLKAKGKKPQLPVLTMNSCIEKMWSTACQQAFQTIIEKLTTAPVLGFADLSSPFLLHTDASNTGLGACLYQEQEGQLRVIAYASRGLTKSEVNYPAHKKEFLALKWSVTDKFHDYLYGGKFTVVTDNNPLTYVLSTAKLDATGYRWLAALSVYNFDLRYRRGLDHSDADGLSRRPHKLPESDKEFEDTMENISWLTSRAQQLESDSNTSNLSSGEVNAVLSGYGIVAGKAQRNTVSCNMSRVQRKVNAMLNVPLANKALVEGLVANQHAVPNNLDIPCDSFVPMVSINTMEWVKLQEADTDIKSIRVLVKDNSRPSKKDTSVSSPEFKVYLREIDKLKLVNGVLYRFVTDDKGLAWQQLVIPPSHRDLAMAGIHEELAHSGSQTTIRLAKQRFFWPFMASMIEAKCKSCERCIRRKALPDKAGMESIRTSYPLQLVCMDFLSIEPDNKGVKDVLVVTDHFTKYALAIPTKNQTARVVADALWENLISHYGWPERLHSDQGKDFESKVIAELCKLGNIRKSRTTPYHPQGNPVERFNRTLLNMLGTLHESQKREWRKYVKPLTHAYNCTVNETTGYSPYFLMFGRHARLPIDVAFGTDPGVRQSDKTPSQYVKELKEKLQYAYDMAKANAQKSSEKNKKTYDTRARAVQLEPGDRVLVKNVNIRGKHKIADKWESQVYIVKSWSPNLPVYTVVNETGQGPERTLHRNLLLPCGSLPLDYQPAESQPPTRMKTRAKKPMKACNDIPEESDDEIELNVSHGDIPEVILTYPDRCPTVSVTDSNLSPHASTFVPEKKQHAQDRVPPNNQSANPDESISVDLNDDSVITQGILNPDENLSSDRDLLGRPSLSNSLESCSPNRSISLDNTEIPNDELEDFTPDVVEPAESIVRRSSRNRQAPERMTFDTLGVPNTQRMDIHAPKSESGKGWLGWALSLFTASPKHNDIVDL